MCTLLMAAQLTSPLNPIAVGKVEGDENDESELDNATQKEVDKIPGCSNNNENNDSLQLQQQQQQERDSSSAHTDSENDEEETQERIKPSPAGNKSRPDEEINKNSNEGNTIQVSDNTGEVLQSKLPKWPRPPTPRSPRRSYQLAGKKKLIEEEEDTSSDENFNSDCTKESYVQMRLRRKTLLKIEKLTDSDSRSRERMRSRALSPPTSSDEENLYIGWVAYPASFSSPRIPKDQRKHHRQRVACACAQAIKCIFSPVAKVCRKCRNNKVWDSESAQEKLLDQNQTQADHVVGDQ